MNKVVMSDNINLTTKFCGVEWCALPNHITVSDLFILFGLPGHHYAIIAFLHT